MPGAADLDAIRDEAFRLLAAAPEERDSPFRSPALASCGADGVPAVRTVVLRGFDPARRVLSFHSDLRAAKVAQLRQHPAVSLHVWDSGRKVQLRLDGRAAVQAGSAAARAAWDALPSRSRGGYHQGVAPDTPLPSAAAAQPDALDDVAAFGNFALVEVAVAAMEWLLLDREGNRRALFTWQDGVPAATWLAP
jgi:pyridoxamine 5'-phosphate oxidase